MASEADAATGGGAQTAITERRNSPVEYWPLTAFFGWTLIGWGLWLLTIHALEGTGHAPPDPETVPKNALILGFVARLYTSLLQHGMLVMLIGTLFYALFQALALAKDDAWLDGRLAGRSATGTIARLIAACAGRPAFFWGDLAANPGRQRLSAFVEHLRFGGAAGMMPLRFALWAFPMFGFLGTVIGLSAAIGELSIIVSQSGGVSAEILEPVLVNLNVAFDTTIQGILSAVIVILFVAAFDRGWERLDHRLKIERASFGEPDPMPRPLPELEAGEPS